MTDLDALLAEWEAQGPWKPSADDFQLLVDEIAALRERHTTALTAINQVLACRGPFYANKAARDLLREAVLDEATREPTYRAGAENTVYRGIHPLDEATRETPKGTIS